MTERALRRLPRNDRPHQLDVIGAALMVGAALSLMLALCVGRHPLSVELRCASSRWSRARRRCGSLFAVRLSHRARTVHSARDSAWPGDQHDHRRRHSSRIGTIIGVTIYMPLYCQTVLGVSASLSGLALIAFMGGATLGSLMSTRLIVRIKHYMRVPIVGLVDCRDRALADLRRRPGAAFARRGRGACCSCSASVSDRCIRSARSSCRTCVKPHQLGTATGTLNFFRTLGGAIVVAVFGAIVLGGISDGAGRHDAGKDRGEPRRPGAGLPLGLHRGGDLPCHCVPLPAGGRGAAAAWAGAPRPRRRRIADRIAAPPPVPCCSARAERKACGLIGARLIVSACSIGKQQNRRTSDATGRRSDAWGGHDRTRRAKTRQARSPHHHQRPGAGDVSCPRSIRPSWRRRCRRSAAPSTISRTCPGS